jgi:hypothetical protein
MARTRTIPSHGEMVSRIVTIAASAAPSEIAAGAVWYANGRAFAETLATGTRYSVDQVCGVIAALSPQCPWSQNKAWAEALVKAHAGYEDCPAVSTGDNRRKAWRILNGECPTAVLGGPKVTAFYANLIGDSSFVTVDLWAYYVATGEKLPSSRGVPKWAYVPIQQAYHEAARLLHLAPAVVQAATWVAARGSAE